MAIEPETWSYPENVRYDGTLSGYIAAVLDWLATHDPDAVNATFLWNGNAIVIDAATARGERQQ